MQTAASAPMLHTLRMETPLSRLLKEREEQLGLEGPEQGAKAYAVSQGIKPDSPAGLVAKRAYHRWRAGHNPNPQKKKREGIAQFLGISDKMLDVRLSPLPEVTPIRVLEKKVDESLERLRAVEQILAELRTLLAALVGGEAVVQTLPEVVGQRRDALVQGLGKALREDGEAPAETPSRQAAGRPIS